ncbi:MAG: type VI secretion system tube protein Hcp [Myxococcales bacterium]|nr:type VI secretion system tube protein Hcp [Myxococcales bacterium]
MLTNLLITVGPGGDQAVDVLFGEDLTMNGQGDTDTSAWLECSAFEVALQTGVQGTHGSSQSTGHRIWSPAKFRLRVGKSTPTLFEAARMNHKINLTLHFFHRHHETGAIEQNFQYRIQQGRITKISLVQPNTLHPETASLHDYVELEVVPNVAEVESMTGGTLSVDDWSALGAS